MKRNKTLLYCFGSFILAAIGWQLYRAGQDEMVCHRDYESDTLQCKPLCPYGQFALPWMETCRKWLSCTEIRQDVHIIEALGRGAVKVTYLAKWRGHHVVLNTLISKDLNSDFRHGMNMIAGLQPTKYVIQFMGQCGNTFVTEYHKFGTAENLHSLLQEYPFHGTVKKRLDLCINYASIINYLHNSPKGTRVMCDSNYLSKTLSQFLIRSDFTLLVNDLDALPRVDKARGELVKCGHRMITGDFAAPEQRWDSMDEFDDDLVTPYDEKTDIWKIPDVCDHILGQAPGSDALRFQLFNLHKACKQINPDWRPTAQQVIDEYKGIRDEL